jgi:hypothetical protein
MEIKECIRLAEDLFKGIQNEFPKMRMILDFEAKYVELSLDIPKQEGLDFDINLNLQTDELHISTTFLWAQTFPITSQEVRDYFLEDVIGLIKGEYRVKQFLRNGEVCKSILQKPENSEWENRDTHYLKITFPWLNYEENIIQNLKSSKFIKLYNDDD